MWYVQILHIPLPMTQLRSKILYIALCTRKGGIDRSFPVGTIFFLCPKESKMSKNDEKGEIVLYQPEGEVRLEVRMEKESVWLSQMQMADLFQKDRTVIGRHIKNIYKEGELAKDITCANFAHVGVDADQTYKLPMKGR